MPRAALVRITALLLAAAAGAGSLPARDLTLSKLNRTYTDLVGELPPFVADPVRLTLRSPSQTVHVRSHRARMAPRADGAFDGQLEIELLGKGALLADLEVGGVRRQLSDEVVIPPQTLRLDARVRLSRVEGGYRVLADGLPRRVEVAIQSRVINDALSLCDTAAVLSFGALDCGPLALALSRPAVQLPPEVDHFLSDGDLGDADRAALDALIASLRP